jgi:hypothetical protein
MDVFRDDLTFWRSAVRLAPRPDAHYRLAPSRRRADIMIGASSTTGPPSG